MNAYLQIEKARFREQLSVDIAIPDALKQASLPVFSLQPIVENAIKHGTSQIFEQGKITISARAEGNTLVILITDNAGLYQPTGMSDGLGMGLVDKRIKVRYGKQYGLSVHCEPEVKTTIILTLPFDSPAGAAAPPDN